jgi:hypothetical protein
MNRQFLRGLATVLWLLAGWGVGDFAAYFAGIDAAAVGPLFGLAMAVFWGGDPFHLIWTPRTARERIRGPLTSQADALR